MSTYKSSPRPTFDGPTPIPYADVTRHLWGDADSGEVADWIYVSSGKIHQLVFGLAPGGIFRHSDAFRTVFSEADVTGQSYLTNTPIRRFGEVEDVANAVRFLVGPEPSWITGVNLAIDGGHHLRSGPAYAPIARMLHSEVVDGRILD